MNPGRRDPNDNHRAVNRLSLVAFVLAALVLILSLAFPAGAAPTYPPLAGRVTDAANILPAAVETDLDAKLAALETATTTQLVVATVPDLQGREIDEYGYQLGRAWGIGQKGKNNGALLLIAPNERKVRIEVGYGLEGVLTDALTSQIIRRDIIPYFKAGDMAGGVAAGTDALIKHLELPADQQAAAALQASQRQQSGNRSRSGLGTWIWLAIILIWVFVSIARGKRGQRSGTNIIWGPGMGGWGGGGGGGGWGGGFGGGGGSFGGGGSSGGW